MQNELNWYQNSILKTAALKLKAPKSKYSEKWKEGNKYYNAYKNDEQMTGEYRFTKIPYTSVWADSPRKALRKILDRIKRPESFSHEEVETAKRIKSLHDSFEGSVICLEDNRYPQFTGNDEVKNPNEEIWGDLANRDNPEENEDLPPITKHHSGKWSYPKKDKKL